MRFFKKFIVLLSLAILVASVLLYFLYDNYLIRKTDLILQEQKNIQSQYASVIGDQRSIAKIYYEEALSNSRVLSYLQQAYTAAPEQKTVLRQELKGALQPVFQHLQEKNFDYVLFYLQNGEVLLRLHQPDKFGDNLSLERYSIRLVNQRRHYVEGFEVNSDYNGYRFIFPLFADSRYLGGIELGVSLQKFRNEMNNRFPVYYEFLLKRENLNRKLDVVGSQAYISSDFSNDYVLERDNARVKRIYSVSPEITALIEWQIKEAAVSLLPSGKAFTLEAVAKNINYLTTFLPINSVTEKQVGYLAVYSQDTALYLLRDGLYVQFIIVLSLMIIAIFFVYYIHESQGKLVSQTEELHSIAQTIGEGLVVIRKDRRVTFFNTAAESISGFLSEEALGKHYNKTLSFVKEDTDVAMSDFIKDVLEKQKIVSISKDIALVRKDGNHVPLGVNAAPLLNREGRIWACVVIFRDVTREREVDKAKTEFVSLASHQLQTPLSAVSWHTEMLLDNKAGKLNHKQKEFLQAIYDGNQRMIKLVNSLLNVSRIDMGTLSINPQPVNLAKLTDSLLDELLLRNDVKRIQIIKQYSRLPKVKLDPQLMRIVLQNVLSNAIKYSRERGKIIVAMAKNKKNALLVVQDFGYGIPADQQNKIFSKLFRADNAKTRKVEGTGLGLYVARSVVEAFGGRIWFSSQENKGTTFFISLPLSGAKKIFGTRGLERNT